VDQLEHMPDMDFHLQNCTAEAGGNKLQAAISKSKPTPSNSRCHVEMTQSGAALKVTPPDHQQRSSGTC